jgi:D-xylose 1-dehydrogenase (NADP+, D-xylono-1,5-lactone-forming)
VGLRLALLSTARINAAIVGGAAEVDEVEVVGAGSRSLERAEAHAREHGLERAWGSYEAVLEDPDVDAVYVPLPNSEHVPWAIRALEAGKHVLCEKPLARSAAEAERAFDVAERTGRVLTEAFMWRHHPQTARLVEAAGRLGELRLVRAQFSFPLTREGDVRLSTALEGGALMDVGCYCVSGIRLLLGEPVDAKAHAVLGGDGVDVRMTGSFAFGEDPSEGGPLAHFDCAMDLPGRAMLEVVGAEGSIVSFDPWHGKAPRLELRGLDGAVEDVAVEPADPYAHQLRDFAAACAGERAPLLGREDAVGQARAIELLYASL